MHKLKHTWMHTQHENKISSTEFLQYQELIMATITYTTVTLDMYHNKFILQLYGSSDVVINNFSNFQNAYVSTIYHHRFYHEFEWSFL